MAQAFLMRMDHLDRLLELELARLLDPIVDAPFPRRRRRRWAHPDLVVLVEPVPLAIVAPIVTPVS